MNSRIVIWPFLWAALVASAQETGSGWTYQGRLDSEGGLAEGVFDFEFALHTGPTGPEEPEAILTNQAVRVEGGLFTTRLGFDPAVADGTAYWLAIGVRTNGTADSFTALEPRQPVSAVPYAWFTANADQAATASLATQVATDGVGADSIRDGSILATKLAAGQVVTGLNGLSDQVILAAGPNTSLASDGNTVTIAGVEDWHLGGNADTQPGLHFIGTTDAQPLELRVNGVRAMRLEPTPSAGAVNVIGGSAVNVVPTNIYGATIGGGGDGGFAGTDSSSANVARANHSTVSGGLANLIDTNAAWAIIGGGFSNRVLLFSHAAAVAGGSENRVSTFAHQAAIAGGWQNVIGDSCFLSAIGGGWSNIVDSFFVTVPGGRHNYVAPGARFSTVGGGDSNRVWNASFASTIAGGGENNVFANSQRSTVSGGKLNAVGPNSPHGVIGGGFTNIIGSGAEAATIPGGWGNRADGSYSYAAGRRAQAAHAGAFVWADGVDAAFSSTLTNEFNVRATGGVRLVTGLTSGGAPEVGVELAPGSGSWSVLSDQNAKENLTEIDSGEVLKQVARLPISSWNYRTQDPAIRHLGPSAQAFHAAFGLGDSDRRIASVDADGVALAAIQGLNRKLETALAERDARIAELERLVKALTADPVRERAPYIGGVSGGL